MGPVEGDGDTWAMDGLGVALAPPRMPPANRIARTATTATAAMRIAGPALPESPPEPVACVVTIGWRSTGDSSVAQFRQKTRSGGFTVPQFGQTIPLGGGGGGGPGSGVGSGLVSVPGPVAPPSGVGFWIGLGSAVFWGPGSASFSPVHSRNEPHEPQKPPRPRSRNPQTLQVITRVSGQWTFADSGV